MPSSASVGISLSITAGLHTHCSVGKPHKWHSHTDFGPSANASNTTDLQAANQWSLNSASHTLKDLLSELEPVPHDGFALMKSQPSQSD